MNLKKNGEVTLKVRSVTGDGDGICEIIGENEPDTRVVFCFGAKPGETVRATVIKVNASYVVCRLKDRTVSSDCASFPMCGGCSLRHFSYGETLAIKEREVRDCLKKIGGFSELPLEPIVPSPETGAYRNKTIYRFVREKDGALTCGFYRRASHAAVPCGDCRVETERSRRVREAFCAAADSAGLSVYDEKTGRGLLRALMVRTANASEETQAAVCVNGDKLPHGEEIVRRVIETCPFVTSFFLNVNRDATNTIFTEDFRKLYGKDTLSDRIGDAEFCISPNSFFQVNPGATEKLYAKAVEYAALSEADAVLDLYCGIGTIGIYAAKKTGMLKGLLGIEYTEKAVENARANAAANRLGIRPVYVAGDADRVLQELGEGNTRNPEAEALLKKLSVIIVDPPRKGLEGKVTERLSSLAADRLVYVSCNPATLARDLKLLAGFGWKPVKACPVDMFPFSGHVETVVLLSKATK